jgi:DNA polymerase-4
MDTVSSSFFIPRKEQGYSDIFKRVRMMPLYSFPHYKDLKPHINHEKNRFFIHLDFDAFYAQVEQRDNPSLRGKPVSVGSTTGEKGIVMTASYEARALGIDTAMSLWQAKKICPKLISVPCYGPKYEGIMLNLIRGLRCFVPEDCIEMYSIDECFIDVTPVVRDFGQAKELAMAIKQKVSDLEDLTCSLGVSWNKTYTKMATKFEKPDGLTVITPADRHKIYELPVKKMWGIGTRISRRLGVMNIFTIGELASASELALCREFGVNGTVFRRLARGEDTSGIIHTRGREKSLNHHHTLTHNVWKYEEIESEIRRITEYICRKLRSKELVTRSLYLVIRYDNLRYAGDDTKLDTATNDDREIFKAAMNIFVKFPRPCESLRARMFGMTVFDLHEDLHRYTPSLFGNNVRLPYYELDKLKYKYGEGIIRVGLNAG